MKTFIFCKIQSVYKFNVFEPNPQDFCLLVLFPLLLALLLMESLLEFLSSHMVKTSHSVPFDSMFWDTSHFDKDQNIYKHLLFSFFSHLFSTPPSFEFFGQRNVLSNDSYTCLFLFQSVLLLRYRSSHNCRVQWTYRGNSEAKEF